MKIHVFSEMMLCCWPCTIWSFEELSDFMLDCLILKMEALWLLESWGLLAQHSITPRKLEYAKLHLPNLKSKIMLHRKFWYHKYVKILNNNLLYNHHHQTINLDRWVNSNILGNVFNQPEKNLCHLLHIFSNTLIQMQEPLIHNTFKSQTNTKI
jgi:hypothetical protein